MASDASISGKGWVWSLKIAFQGDKKFASCTLCLKNPVICFQNLASKKVNHWGEKAHQVPQQSRKEQLLRKSLEREEASGWAKRMTASLVPTPVCSSWSFCSPAVREWSCPLALIVNIPHKQWPGSLTIVHSVFICESPFLAQCAKPFFSLVQSWRPKCSCNFGWKH